MLASVNREKKSSIHDRFNSAALEGTIWDSSTSELNALELKMWVQSLYIADIFSDQLTGIKQKSLSKKQFVEVNEYIYIYIQDLDGRIILRWIFRKLEGVVGTGWSWLKIGTGGGHLWVR